MIMYNFKICLISLRQLIEFNYVLVYHFREHLTLNDTLDENVEQISFDSVG